MGDHRRALILDFDGVILDTETPYFRSWREVYAEFGLELGDHQWAAGLGHEWDPLAPFGPLEAAVGRAVDRPAIAERRARREAALIAREPLLPGVEALLDQATSAGVKIGVASNSDRTWVLGHLERLGLGDTFDAVRCEDDVAAVKPEPDLYLSVLEALEAAPSQAVAIEDSVNGVLAARRAGVFCVAVPNQVTRQLDFDTADLVLTSLVGVSLAKLFESATRASHT